MAHLITSTKLTQSFSGKAAKDNHKRIQKLAVLFGKKDCPILDLGCGDGVLIQSIAEKLQIKNVDGIEIHKKRFDISRKKGIRVKKADLNKKFPFESKNFDMIIANQIIEHLCFTDNFIEEVKRCLKPGGILVISTTNLSALQARLLLLFGYQPNCIHPSLYPVGTLIRIKGNNPQHGHKSLFTGRALKEFLEIHKFEVLKYETQTIPRLPRILSKLICHFFDFGTHTNIVAKKL